WSRITSGCSLMSGLQDWQTLRRSRWAQIRLTEEATRKGSIPMSMIRLIVLGASLVWSVERTRWPVNAALVAMEAVSRSRISPTMMMLGSWRRNAFSAAENVSPTSSWISTWLIPSRLYSTGSSAVMMLVSGTLILESAE